MTLTSNLSIEEMLAIICSEKLREIFKVLEYVVRYVRFDIRIKINHIKLVRIVHL
jgi:hypothetical protein